MLVEDLLEFYNGFLFSIIMCYITCRLNSDLKNVSFPKYICSSLIITAVLFAINVFVPDINMIVRAAALISCVVFVMLLIYRYSLYHSTITAFFGVILIGFAELFVALAYAYPLKLTLDKYRSSFVHITAGGILSFLFIYFILKLMADNFIKVRKRIYKKYPRFTLLLCANMLTVFIILLFVFSLLGYYSGFNAISGGNNPMYLSIILISVVLLASISGTIYLINFFILNRIKYDRLKLDNVMDGMTNTLNRVSGLRFIEEQLEICKKSEHSLTICYVDVNDLKIINDMLGHKEGDRLIKTIVAAIKENIRETDVISRLGGDEFVIVFPGCSTDYAAKVLNRISEKLKQLKPLSTDEEYTISISFGFSEYEGDCHTTVDMLLDKADHQMYLNKRAIKSMANFI